jgi:RNA polymerase sigma-70 factor (ECF subfamily)
MCAVTDANPAQLLARVGATGDLDALGRLFDETAPGLLRLALRVTGDPAEAEDVLQETFLAVLRGAATYDSTRPAGAWLARVLSNVAARRRRRRVPARLEAASEAVLHSPPEPTPSGEAWRATRAAIEALPQRERVAMLLRYEQRLETARVAEILGVRESSVRSLLARGTARLRRRLGPAAPAFFAAPGRSMSDILGRVRESVLQGASATVAGGVAVSAVPVSVAVLGGLAVKKTAIAAVALLALVGGGGVWWALAPKDVPESDGSATASSAERGPPSQPEPATGETRLAAAPPRATPARPAEAAPGVPRYGGRLVDEEGRPVTEAEIEILEGWEKVDGKVRSFDAATLPRRKPAADGRFDLGLQEGQGQVTVRLHTPGRVPRWGGADQMIFPDRGEDIVLVRVAPLSIRVLEGESERGVRGALVSAFGALHRSADELRSAKPKTEARTDEQGRAVVGVVPGLGVLVVRASGFAPRILADLDVPSAGHAVTVRLPRGARIEGRLVDGEGRAMPGFQVEAKGFPLFDQALTTDADGRFTVKDAPSASDPPEPVLNYRLALWVQKPGIPSARWFRVDPPAAGETKSLTFVWHEARALQGRVRTASGAPVATLSVKALGAGRGNEVEGVAPDAQTDAEGRFRFARIPPGAVVLRAAGAPETRLDVPARGDVPEVEIVVPDPRGQERLIVVVRRTDGEPLAGASVRFLARGAGRPEGKAQTTDANGETRLEGDRLRDGSVVVTATGWAPHVHPVGEEAAPEGRVDVRLPAGLVRGRVVRLDGTAVRTGVWATSIVPVPHRSHPAWVGGDQPHKLLETDAEGGFVVQGVGEHEIRLSTPWEWKLAGGPVRARAGDVVTLKVGTEDEMRDLYVEAEVRGEDGLPLRGWHLQLVLVPPGAPSTAMLPFHAQMSQIDGTENVYRSFYPVPAGTYDIVIPQRFGWKEARAIGVRVALGVPRKRQVMRLDRGESIRGRVTEADGTPAAGLTVEAAGQTAGVREDGTYELRGLDAGSTEVRVTGAFAETALRRVSVGGGEATSVDFTVTSGGSIDLAPKGSSGLRSRVRAVALPLRGGASVVLDVDARSYGALLDRYEPLRFARLAPGRWQVEVEWDSRNVLSKEVDVGVRRTTTLEFEP